MQAHAGRFDAYAGRTHCWRPMARPLSLSSSLRPPAAPLVWRWRLLVTGVVLLAAGLRLWVLDNRPPHFDEGVNGMFTDRMVANGFYAYDPTNYHGPLHFYVLFLFKRLLGRNLWALRLPVALVSAATVWLVCRFDRFFSRSVCLVAALGLALSPASVYFGRDAIHESWLAFFLLLTLLGTLGLWRDGGRRDLWALGLGLTGMVLTKETYVIHVAALALALGTLWTWEQFAEILPRLVPPRLAAVVLLPRPAGLPPPAVPARWTTGDLVAVTIVGVGSIVFFYSGTFFNPGGLKGLYETFAPWIHKSQAGEGHNKPFRYWLDLLAGQEPWAFAGVLASVTLLWARTTWPMRYVAVYALGTLLAYSLIPYKTPWCMVSIVWPFFFPAAAALTALGRWRWRRPAGAVVATLLLGVLTAFTAWRTTDLSFGHPSEARDEHLEMRVPKEGDIVGTLLRVLPWTRARTVGGEGGGGAETLLRWDIPQYVYVQTYDAVRELTIPLDDLVRENPANQGIRGLVLADHYHPLPWLLGDFYRVGYYGREGKPENYRADFLVVSADRVAEVEAGLGEPYFRQSFELRPAASTLTMYLRAGLFVHLMPEREPEFIPGDAASEGIEPAVPAPAPNPAAP